MPSDPTQVAKQLAEAKSDHDALSTFRQIRRLPGNIDGKLGKTARVELFRLGVPSTVCALITKNVGDEDFCEEAWDIMYAMSASQNPDDASEDETARLMSSVPDWYPLAIQELKFRPCRESALFNLCNLLVSVSLVPESAEMVAKNGLVPYIVDVFKLLGSQTVGSLTLSVLRSLSQHPATHSTLRAANVLEATLPWFKLLGSTNQGELSQGLRAASLVCRLCGHEETGPGADAIWGNPLVVTKTIWFFAGVIDAGPLGTFLGGRTNPGNVAFDIYTLATSDKNKPLLPPVVPVIVRGLKTRAANIKLVQYSISTLALLSYDVNSKSALISAKQDLLGLGDSLKAINLSEEVKRDLAYLLDWLENGMEKSDARRPSLLRRLSGTTKAVGASSKAAASSELAPTRAGKHSFVSYAWANSTVVQPVCQWMLQHEVPIWWDKVNMAADSDTIEAMANGITEAHTVICFFSPAYKASANCRSELTMAHELKKPIVFVRVNDDYVGDGWLKFIMGAALWEDASHADVELLGSTLITRIKTLTTGSADFGGKPPGLPVSSPALKSAPMSAGGATADSGAILDALKSLRTSVDELKSVVSSQAEQLRAQAEVIAKQTVVIEQIKGKMG